MPAISEVTREYRRGWFQQHPEKVRVYNERSRAHIKSDPTLSEQLRASKKEGSRQRRLTVRGCLQNCLYSARYRAKKHDILFNLTLDHLLEIFPTDGKCPFAQQPFVLGNGHHPMNISLDKIIPALGYTIGNVQIISRVVNTMKQNCLDPDVFRRMADFLEHYQIGQRLGCPQFRVT